MVGERLRRGRKTSSIVLSPLVAFVLLSAPTVRAVQNVCDQCPPTCPMHRTVKSQRSKPSCHNQGSMHMQQTQERHDASGTAFSRPPCGHRGTVPGAAMGPMILLDGISTRLRLPAAGLALRQKPLRIRFNEPPNPPPPIAAS